MAKEDIYNKMLGAEEDSRDKVIKELPPDELKEAISILEEKIDEIPDEDNPSFSKESDDSDKTDTDNSDDDTKKEGDENKEGDKKDDDTPPPDGDDKDFLLTQDLIEKQPEENRGILANFKDKNKDEIAQAAAHAVAMKSPYLKDNEKAIAVMKEQFLEKTGDELINILVDTQKEVGKAEPKKEEFKAEPVKEIELPDMPEDDPEIKKILEKETLKRLKAKYPNMPDVDSMASEEYLEWRRDFDADNPDNEYKSDRSQTEKIVKDELSKIVYIQKNLPNIYQDSPNEILPLLTKENLPRLKALNDDPMNVLVQDIGKEIETIRKGLEKYGLTEKDLEMDLTITKDESGLPYNEILNKLIMEGTASDGTPIPSSKIIAQRGKTYWLKPGELARKFKDEFDDKILTAFVSKKTQTDKQRKEKLKDETLREGSQRGLGGKKVLTVEDIHKLSPDENKAFLAELERSI